MLVVRELSLGPLRFSELARSVGDAPTDVLTKRLRDLEADGIVSRRELPPPAAATVYELTELGRGLERPMMELARWGVDLMTVEEFTDISPTSLPNALRVILRPPRDFELALALRSDGQGYLLRFAGGWIAASRGPAAADLTLSGEPIDVVAALVVGAEAEERIEIEGDRGALRALRAMVEVSDRIRAEAVGFYASSVPS